MKFEIGMGVSVCVEEAKDSFSCRDWNVVNSEVKDDK